MANYQLHDLFKEGKVEENKAEPVILSGSPLSTHQVLPSPSINKQLIVPSTPQFSPSLGLLEKSCGAGEKKKQTQKTNRNRYLPGKKNQTYFPLCLGCGRGM